jgi:hypothetical protein
MSAHGTSQPWQLPRRTAGHGSKADSDVPRITRELRLLTFEYPGERYAWPLEPAVTLTARSPKRLFHLVFESHDGRALVPSPKRSESPRATLTPEWWMA